MAKGSFIFKQYDYNGNLINEVQGENSLSSHFPNIMAGNFGRRVSDSVKFFRIGSDNTPMALPSSLLSEISGGNKPIDEYSVWDNTQSQFILVVERNEFNLVQIGEFGLYTQGGRLVARFVLPQSQVKTTGTRYEIIWRIEFF